MRKLLLGLTALSMTLPLATSPADAQYRARSQRYHHNYRHHCHHGTTGALIGGGAGALVGSAVTHGIAGPLVGAAGGALLGRHIARHSNCRR
jgi:uncharacterized membrane protein YsdA (DUF1294 family)